MRCVHFCLLFAMLCLTLNGCSSSSTTAQPPKSADDQIRELLVKAAALPKDAKKEDGEAILLQLMLLRDKASEETQKEVDQFLIKMVISTSFDSEAGPRKAVKSASAVDPAFLEKHDVAPAGQNKPPMPNPKVVDANVIPERGPQPREVN